jgi:hypothetical protein
MLCGDETNGAKGGLDLQASAELEGDRGGLVKGNDDSNEVLAGVNGTQSLSESSLKTKTVSCIGSNLTFKSMGVTSVATEDRRGVKEGEVVSPTMSILPYTLYCPAFSNQTSSFPWPLLI